MRITGLLVVIIIVAVLQINKVCAQSNPDTSTQHSFVEPEESEPYFPGGRDSLEKFVSSNIHHIKGAEGKKVFVTFAVETDGSLSNIKVSRGLNNEANEEALRLLRISPKWVPGTQANHVHRYQYVLPIKFPDN
ncbi:MAG: energy transducer TonB [Bacteroidetes bacterium]|jgi:protein TonB|nr:energy transducer TonB [Bacteroidota bacterium]